jgi:DNA-binding PadR family transcriptional regulator
MIKGYLRMIILKELMRGDKSGYELMKAVAQCYNTKPSSGSIYPLLTTLLESKFVTSYEEGRKKKYCITPKGKAEIKKILEEKEKMMLKHIELVQICNSITRGKDCASPSKVVHALRSKEDVVVRNLPLWIELKETMMRLIVSSYSKEKERKARDVLWTTIEKLKKIEKQN